MGLHTTRGGGPRGVRKDGRSRLEVSGSPGRIRTCDTLINSQLRYHCATGECYGVRRTSNNYSGSPNSCKEKFGPRLRP